MRRHQIPTAEYSHFDDYDQAVRYLNEKDYRVAIKVDGLAAGKGVILPQTKEEGQEALRDIMVNSKFGSAGQ